MCFIGKIIETKVKIKSFIVTQGMINQHYLSLFGNVKIESKPLYNRDIIKDE